jgi:hypothetical protein
MAIKDVLYAFRLTSVRENYKLDPTRRPDLHIISLRQQVIIDVTVVDDVNSANPGLMDDAAVEKHKHYDDLAQRLGFRFFAVPMSSYGKLHEETHKFIEHMARQVGAHKRSELRTALRTAIEHALLDGNADIVDHTMARLCDRVGDWLE